MVVIAVEMMSTPLTALNVHVMILQRQHKPLDPIVNHHNGLVITTVMMKTIIQSAVLMVVIVVEMMSTPLTALNVHVMILQRQHKPLKDPIVYFHNGLVIATVTMKTIIQSAVLMVVIAVEMMSTPLTALNVHVLNDFKFLILRNIFRTY